MIEFTLTMIVYKPLAWVEMFLQLLIYFWSHFGLRNVGIIDLVCKLLSHWLGWRLFTSRFGLILAEGQCWYYNMGKILGLYRLNRCMY
jgi:hypothetical protein